MAGAMALPISEDTAQLPPPRAAASSREAPSLVLDAIGKRFGHAHAVDGVSLVVPGGQFVGVIGRSGAGKSTLLRLVNRLIEPTTGRVLWDGVEVSALEGRRLRDWRRRCAMIFQQFGLVGRLDVLNNVLMGRLAFAPAWQSLPKLWSRDDRRLALAALERFGIAELAAMRVDNLSGGQQQRVAICRALVQEPEIVLADEPVASLDPENSRVVMESLRRVNRHFGVTVLCNLHSLELARTYCDRLVGMAAGRVVFDGVPSALTEDAAAGLYGVAERPSLDLPAPALPSGAAVAPA